MSKKKLNKTKQKHSSSSESTSLLNHVLHSTAELYQKGEIKEALKLTEEALVKFPKQPLLLSNAGIFSIRTGAEQSAVKYFQKSLKLDPSNPETYNNLGNVYKDSDQLNKAEIAYKNALRLKPDYANALYNLGNLFLLKKDYKKSELALNRVLEIKPGYIEAFNTLGNLFLKQNLYQKAEFAYHNALKLHANNADTYINLGRLYFKQKRFEEAEICYSNALTLRPNHVGSLNNLGGLYTSLKRFQDAEKCFITALKVAPESAEIFNGLACLFLEQKNYTSALTMCNKALHLKPDYSSSYNNLGLIYLAQEHLPDAETAFLTAILKKPDNVEANYNLGNLYQRLKRYPESETFYKKALTIRTNFIDAQANLAILLLMLGRFKEGWKFYESRYHPDKEERKTFPPEFTVPQWQGENLTDKSMLIWPEQGVGDEIMFASCLNELQKYRNKIFVACDKRLQKLFKRSFPFLNIIEIDPSNQYQALEKTLDFHCALGSLPHFFRNNAANFKSVTNYIKAEEHLLSKWKQRYSQLKYPINIGISWRGGKNKQYQQLRSLALHEWLPILKNKANFINLQYGNHQTEIIDFSTATNIPIYDWDDADPLTDLDNFSAQIKALDLVISIDNATVHFSGALGTHTFVLLPYHHEWRWGSKRTDSVWYPHNMKLFHQKTEADWKNVIDDISNILKKKTSIPS